MESQSQAQATDRLDLRLYVPLLAHALLIQMLVAMSRVTTSYRAIEIGLSSFELGLIQGGFFLLPVFAAVAVGRYIDRGHDAEAIWIGSALFALGCAVAWLAGQIGLWLFVSSAVCGVGHLFLMAGHQMVCLRAAGVANRESAFGNFMVVTAIGQAIGPTVIGILGGSASLAPTQFLFLLCVLSGAAAVALSFGMRPEVPKRSAADEHAALPVRDLLRMRGVLIFMLASVITVTSQDIAIIYLPLMGIERGIDVGRIGVILTLRAVAAMVSRIFYARLLATFGRIPLMIGSLALSGAGCIGLSLPVPVWGLYVASSLMGLGLGIATTLSITSLMAISPAEARATLNSVRITGNRVGQVTLPLLAGLVAAGTGAGGVMAVTGLAILAVGVATHLDRKR